MSQNSNDLQAPILHLNGSGFDNLFRQYAEAAGSVRKALQDLPNPHGRDYYVQEGAHERARTEHEARLEKLRGVLHELEAICEELNEQKDKHPRAAL